MCVAVEEDTEDSKKEEKENKECVILRWVLAVD